MPSSTVVDTAMKARRAVKIMGLGGDCFWQARKHANPPLKLVPQEEMDGGKGGGGHVPGEGPT